MPPTLAAGQTLTVDVANGNSPYPITASDAFAGVTVGDTGVGVVNHSAGTLTVSSGLALGNGSTSNGSYNLSGSGSLSTGPVTIGVSGAGTFTQSDTTTFQVAPASLLYLGYNPGSHGTYNLNGGTLTVSTVTGNSGTSTFNFNGGILQAARGGYTFFQGLTMANVQTGGAIIDTQGYGVTLAQSLAHDTTGATTAVDGGLTKLGTGTLNLSGANTFTGVTNVNAGTLNLLNPLALSNSTLNLSNAATAGTVTFDNTVTSRTFILGGLSGSGNVVLASNAATPAAITLSVGNNGTDTTYAGIFSGIGSLTKLGTGTLTLTGANIYTGGTTFAGGTLNAGSTGALGNTGTLSFTGGTLQYSSANQTDYSPRFSRAANQAYSVDTNGQNIIFAGTLASSGGSFTKLGAGTLTLSGTNTYTGGTNISHGTLVAATNGALGSGNVSVAAGATLSLSTGVTAAHNASLGTVLTLASATTSIVNLAGSGVQDTVEELLINGVIEPSGTYGAVGSGAMYTNIADFAGTGELLVVPEPSTWLPVGIVLGLGVIWRWRKA